MNINGLFPIRGRAEMINYKSINDHTLLTRCSSRSAAAAKLPEFTTVANTFMLVSVSIFS